MKSIIAAGVIVGSLSAPAFAGPYANVENNASWIGSEFEMGVTEVHAGYEIEAGEDVAIYVQAGPAFISIEDEDLETEISGYIGITADVSDSFELYGEVGFLTADQEFNTDTLSVSTEVGATYRF